MIIRHLKKIKSEGMDLKKNQTKISKRDTQLTKFQTRICQHLSDNCSYLTKKFDTSKMSENIYDFFTLNQNIFNTTKKFWTKILRVIQQKDTFIGEYICYEILNLENYEDLNYHYKTFLHELTYDKTPYINSKSNNEYFDLVYKLFCSLEFFLYSPLFTLENNIEHLLLTIDMPLKFNEKENEKIFEEKNVGHFINQAITDFLKELKRIIFQLKLLDGPISLSKKKKLVENRIDEVLKAKQYHLESYKLESKAIKPHKSPVTTTELLPGPENAYNHFTNQSLNIFEENSSTENTEGYIDKPIVNDFNKSFSENISNVSTTEHLAETQSTFNKNIIFFGIVISFIFLIFYIILCVKKYFNRKNNSKNIHVRYEIEPFYDIV